MKKATAILLALTLLLATASPVQGAVPPVISPQLDHAREAIVRLNITNTGLAQIDITVTGQPSLQKTDMDVYLERQIGPRWNRVDIGTTNDMWEYTTTARNFTKTYSHQLPGPGVYRAVVDFTFTAGTVEYVTKVATATYTLS